jgi:CheY-like chemotaxis protein
MEVNLPQAPRYTTKSRPCQEIKILVVDDDLDVLAAITLILRHYQGEVIAAAKPQEGLEQGKRHRPDVIISDIGMPHMDGYQFIRAVRNLPSHEGGHTPAIAVTAFNRPEDRTRVSEAGFQSHLSTPIDMHELIKTIAISAGRESHE